MDLLTPEAIIERLEAARRTTSNAGLGAAIAFDGDGTLWRGDVGEDFFYAVVATGKFRPVAVDAMRQVARAFAVDLSSLTDKPDSGAGQTTSDHDTGVAVARHVFTAYLDRLVPEDIICEVIAWLCAGWREEDVVKLARDVVLRGDFAARRFQEIAPVLDWARTHAVEAYLVSASPRQIVEAAGTALGFDRAHVLATTPLFENGIMVADVSRPIPYGPGKASLLADVLGGRALLGAFGDNVFDIPMLEAARVPVVVEPKPRLLTHLATLAGSAAGFGGFFEGKPPVRLKIKGETPVY